jgi:ribosomal protein S18 acetylase RimI-like enzyme
MSFTIRNLAPEDRLACATTFARAWSQAFPHLPRAPDVDAFDFETATENIRVAVDDSGVIGFASLYAPDSFLHHLYVEPDAQRRGVGEALLEDAISRAVNRLSLKCQVSNTHAMAFYTKRGLAKRDHGVDETGAWVRLYAPNPSRP